MTEYISGIQVGHRRLFKKSTAPKGHTQNTLFSK